jgi:multiple sugar transport system substrate-binding protein
MNKKAVKAICILLVTLIMSTAFMACGSGEGSSAGSGETASSPAASASAGNEEATAQAVDLSGTKVTFWNGFTASDGDVLREIYDNFNKTNDKGIKVEMDIMPWANLFEKLATSLATNTAPVMVLLGSDKMTEYIANEGIVELADFWSASGLDQSIYAQSVIDCFKYQGKTYGIPMQYNTQYLYWNKDLFTKAGLDPEKPPKTFTELKEYAAKLTDNSKEQYGIGIASTGSSCYGNITNFMWSNGGDWLTPDMTKAACNSKEAIEVLAMLQGFSTSKQTPAGMAGADTDNLFLAGQLGMYINGPWLVNGAKTNKLNFGIGAVPGSESGKLQVPGGGCAYMVTSSANEKEKLAAYECMKYWLSKDILKEWSIRNGFPAFSSEVLSDPDIQKDPILNALSPLAQYGKLPFPGMPEANQISGDYLDPLYEQLMYGKITPEECAKKMAEGIDTVLAK